MLCFEMMLAQAAADAGMKVPPEEKMDAKGVCAWDREEYPHFFIFCLLQLNRGMSSPDQHWNNAKAIAKIDGEALKTMTMADFAKAGVDLT